MQSKNLKKMTISAIMIALGIVLPFLTGQIQAIARWISPMHIPVFICGLTCGWQWGLGVGFILPLMRGAMFGMPAVPNSALPMAFELAAYGFLTGFLYPRLLRRSIGKTHTPALLISLIVAMILGRIVGGGAKALLLMLGFIGSSNPYTFAAFVSSYFIGTAPGALIHIILVPAVVTALEKAHLSPITDELK